MFVGVETAAHHRKRSFGQPAGHVPVRRCNANSIPVTTGNCHTRTPRRRAPSNEVLPRRARSSDNTPADETSLEEPPPPAIATAAETVGAPPRPTDIFEEEWVRLFLGDRFHEQKKQLDRQLEGGADAARARQQATDKVARTGAVLRNARGPTRSKQSKELVLSSGHSGREEFSVKERTDAIIAMLESRREQYREQKREEIMRYAAKQREMIRKQEERKRQKQRREAERNELANAAGEDGVAGTPAAGEGSPLADQCQRHSQNAVAAKGHSKRIPYVPQLGPPITVWRSPWHKKVIADMAEMKDNVKPKLKKELPQTIVLAEAVLPGDRTPAAMVRGVADKADVNAPDVFPTRVIAVVPEKDEIPAGTTAADSHAQRHSAVKHVKAPMNDKSRFPYVFEMELGVLPEHLNLYLSLKQMPSQFTGKRLKQRNMRVDKMVGHALKNKETARRILETVNGTEKLIESRKEKLLSPPVDTVPGGSILGRILGTKTWNSQPFLDVNDSNVRTSLISGEPHTDGGCASEDASGGEEASTRKTPNLVVVEQNAGKKGKELRDDVQRKLSLTHRSCPSLLSAGADHDNFMPDAAKAKGRRFSTVTPLRQGLSPGGKHAFISPAAPLLGVTTGIVDGEVAGELACRPETLCAASRSPSASPPPPSAEEPRSTEFGGSAFNECLATRDAICAEHFDPTSFVENTDTTSFVESTESAQQLAHQSEGDEPSNLSRPMIPLTLEDLPSGLHVVSPRFQPKLRVWSPKVALIGGATNAVSNAI